MEREILGDHRRPCLSVGALVPEVRSRALNSGTGSGSRGPYRGFHWFVTPLGGARESGGGSCKAVRAWIEEQNRGRGNAGDGLAGWVAFSRFDVFEPHLLCVRGLLPPCIKDPASTPVPLNRSRVEAHADVWVKQGHTCPVQPRSFINRSRPHNRQCPCPPPCGSRPESSWRLLVAPSGVL